MLILWGKEAIWCFLTLSESIWGMSLLKGKKRLSCSRGQDMKSCTFRVTGLKPAQIGSHLKHRWLVLSELVAPRPCFTCWSRVAPCGVAFITFSSNLSHGFRETSFLHPTAKLFRAGKLHCQGNVGKPALPLPFLLHVGVNARCWSAGQPLMIAVIITMGTSYAASMP